MKASLLYDSQCMLAEGPYWKSDWGAFLWVDIEHGTLYSYELESGQLKTWQFPHRLTLVLEQGEVFILALDGKLARFDPKTAQLEWLLELESDPSIRCNDGACDPAGRIWVGTMGLDFREGAGSLFCVDKGWQMTKKLDGVTISNGLAWSLDTKTLYYIDSPTRKIKAFDFDVSTGDIVYRKDAVVVPEELGTPDGMCLDEEGMLWVGHYGGSGVYRWNPEDGTLMDRIEVPAPHVTSCAFGGPEGKHLLITTARENMNAEQLANFPQSGGVFIIELPVKGAPVFQVLI
ncbi:SMP-30/gluconolactonase/LRE family protein [Lunatimonas salinarum]|uniref:SMP-30/gluconolactonase/LRE family protein n=1 Tax=Lunatimonas salinarum TaxID=1774590 RepID=UPI001ADFF268|nr:SMP-30/gluconolactonase/LRE family protein [Lunatimonas salinarum]